MGFFCYYREPGLLWFRIFGRGLLVKNLRRHPFVLFSERNGYYRGFRLGRWLIRYLPNTEH